MPAGSFRIRIFDQKLDPSDWLASYVATDIERNVRTISNIGDLVTPFGPEQLGRKVREALS